MSPLNIALLTDEGGRVTRPLSLVTVTGAGTLTLGAAADAAGQADGTALLRASVDPNGAGRRTRVSGLVAVVVPAVAGDVDAALIASREDLKAPLLGPRWSAGRM